MSISSFSLWADAPFECITCSANGFASRGQSGRSSSEMDLCVSMPMQIEFKKITTPWWWLIQYAVIAKAMHHNRCSLLYMKYTFSLECIVSNKMQRALVYLLGGLGDPCSLDTAFMFLTPNCPQLSVTVNRSQPLTNLQGRPRRDSGEV